MAIGRFQVMAILQAARAYVLGLPVSSAKSFGLNRAIFYAAAKRGFKKGRGHGKPGKVKLPHVTISPAKAKALTESFQPYLLGDEMAYSVKLDGKTLFMIGDEVQTPQSFRRQIADRFPDKEQFRKAWKEAVAICREAGKPLLKSQRYFYETVYKPRRDTLKEEWS